MNSWKIIEIPVWTYIGLLFLNGGLLVIFPVSNKRKATFSSSKSSSKEIVGSFEVF